MGNALKIVTKLMEGKIGKRTTQQIICVLLLIFGVKRREIKEKTGASPTSLCKYEKMIKEERVEELFEAELYRPVSELEKYTKEIEAEFEKQAPKTRREAQEIIKRLTGLERALPNIGKFLKKRV